MARIYNNNNNSSAGSVLRDDRQFRRGDQFEDKTLRLTHKGATEESRNIENKQMQLQGRDGGSPSAQAGWVSGVREPKSQVGLFLGQAHSLEWKVRAFQ